MSPRPAHRGRRHGDRRHRTDEVGADRDGNAQRLSSRGGKFVVLNFWATWCAPCKIEIPLMNDLQSRFGPTGVEVIGVSIDETGWADVNNFVSEQRIGYTVTLADAQMIEAFGGVNQLPMTMVIDRNGRIIAKHIGLLTERGDFYQQIERMLVR
jgi:thiol-disulfide isomerase/thioredoxin